MVRTYLTAVDGSLDCEIDVFLRREAAQAEPDRLECGVARDAHGEQYLGRLDRAGVASAARRYRDGIHVGYDCLRVGALEANVSRVREPTREISDVVDPRTVLTSSRRSSRSRSRATRSASAARSSVAMRAAAPNPTMPATFNEPDLNPPLVSAAMDDRS